MKFLFPTVIHETYVPNFDQDMCVKIARQLKKKIVENQTLLGGKVRFSILIQMTISLM